MKLWLLGPVIISLFNFVEEFQRYYFNPVYSNEIAPELKLSEPCPNLNATFQNTFQTTIPNIIPTTIQTNFSNTFSDQFCENKNYYVLLTNTLFVPIYSSSQVLFGALSDKIHHKKKLQSSIFIFINIAMGLAVLGISYSESITNLIIYRSVFAVFYAGVDPLAAKEIFTMTRADQRGKAMAVYNWAMYVGFGLAFGVAGSLDWRDMFRLSAVAIFPCCIVYSIYYKWNNFGLKLKVCVETDCSETKHFKPEIQNKTLQSSDLSVYEKWRSVGESFLKPNIFILLVASTCRTIAALSYATFGFKYFNEQFPNHENLKLWLMIAPIFGGIVGVTLGGIITDLVLKKKWFSNTDSDSKQNPSRSTAKSRIIVQSFSQILAGPAAWMAINSPAPFCFIFLILTFVLAEMWYGVLFAVLFEIVPDDYNTTFFTVFVFIFINLGAQIFNLVELDQIYDLTIRYFYPIGYSLSGVMFFGAFLLTE